MPSKSAQERMTTDDPRWLKHAAEFWEQRYAEQHATLHRLEDRLSKMHDLRLSLAAAEEEAEVQGERAWSAERELAALQAIVHGHVQVIRGMCTDHLDHREIDRALVRLDDAINPPEEA